MLTQLRSASLLLLMLTILTGGFYPLIVTVIAQLAFPSQAHGSLIKVDGQIHGSALIGQHFTKPEYFWGRLSATSPVPCNAAASSGSNYGPLNPALRDAALARLTALSAAGQQGPVPVDLVTASASGLDPHISPEAANVQVQRVAQARKMPADAVQSLVRQYTQGRQFGLLGEPRVNVLLLNRALDQMRSKN